MNKPIVKIITSAEVTDAVIAEWKAANKRGIWEMTVYSDDDEGTFKKGWFRKATIQELSAAATLKNDPIGVAIDLLKASWLGGDAELIIEDEWLEGALEQYQDMMKTRRGELKKL